MDFVSEKTPIVKCVDDTLDEITLTQLGFDKGVWGWYRSGMNEVWLVEPDCRTLWCVYRYWVKGRPATLEETFDRTLFHKNFVYKH